MLSIPTSTQAWLVLLGWIVVFTGGVTLRFSHLSDRPFHFDEATGARITSQRIDTNSHYQFNPRHNHGPLLSSTAYLACKMAGESSWKKMTKSTLRLVPAIAGSLLVLLPAFWRRKFGDAPMLASASLIATSPLLVYYSRTFIHEMPLTLFGVIALMLMMSKKTRPLALGIVMGMMFATKESFIISLTTWVTSGIILGGIYGLTHQKNQTSPQWRPTIKKLWKRYRTAFAITLSSFLATSIIFYTNAFQTPSGAWDAIRTFFVYQTEPGHDKPLFYYFHLLIIPSKGGIWWFETPILILACLATIQTFLPHPAYQSHRWTIRFLACVTFLHIAIYSVIHYKTPWLMCLPWAYTCLLAGMSLRGISQLKVRSQIMATLLLLLIVTYQTRLSYYATGRFSSSPRNPYAYTPTSRDAESIQDWLKAIAKDLPPKTMEPIAVVGHSYWPLPWYLRQFDTIGYWPSPAPEISQCPVVFAMPETMDSVTKQLQHTHNNGLLRSLRTNVPVMLFLRNDIWEHWMSPEQEIHEQNTSP